MVTIKLTTDEAQEVLDLLNDRITELDEYRSARSLTRSWSGRYEPGPDETQAAREADELREIRAKLTS